jgi:hypothetical protein
MADFVSDFSKMIIGIKNFLYGYSVVAGCVTCYFFRCFIIDGQDSEIGIDLVSVFALGTI